MFFSIRMRASKKNTLNSNSIHISGGERLAKQNDIESITHALLSKALNHKHGMPDEIVVTVEPVNEHLIRKVSALPIITVVVGGHEEGSNAARSILESLSIPDNVITIHQNLLQQGPAPHGGNMRGASIVDIHSFKRLEPDKEAGVRAIKMDFVPATEKKLEKNLKLYRIYNPRTRDALAVATKICLYDGVVAEYCCSDDPDYVGGYVASKKFGYVRINRLKCLGHPLGGRIIYFDQTKGDINDFVRYLRNDCILINNIQPVSRPINIGDLQLLLGSIQ